MSTTTDEELVARLRHMNAETEKFVAEQRKLIAESQKLNWEVRFAPWLALAAVFASIIAAATFIAHLMGH